LRLLYPDRFEAFSAGTAPTGVSPEALKVMSEADADISSHRSKSLDEYRGREFDYVVTVCDNARETCPFFPATKRNIHHGFDNPWDFRGTRGEVLDQFRRVRDEIRAWIVHTFGRDHEERLEDDPVPRIAWPGK